MAVPKRRTSKAKQRKRRTHKKVTSPQISLCPQCQELKLSHRVCLDCGYYDGAEIIQMEQ